MTTLQQIDLSDHDAFLERVPHEWFATLRREDPVHFNPEADGPGFYAVTRYHDIREVHRNVQIYSSELGGTSLEDLDPDQIEARKSMLDMDPPRHDELRGLIARRFTPRAVQVWEDAVRTVTDRVLDLALEKEEFDFVHEISSEIPMQVFAEILGVPQDERRYIIELGDRLLGNQDPEYAQPSDDSHRLLPFSSPAALEMFEFGRKMAAARRKHPGADIVTQLAFEPLTQQEFDVYFVLLATAGNETTRHTITHGLLALLEHPDQLQRLREDPALFKPAADEMLRWATPVHHFRRTTACDAELAGVPDPGRREGHDLVRVRQPRRDRLRGPGHVRRRPHAEQAHGVRARRHPSLHGRAPGPDGDQDRVRGAAQARRHDRAGRRARAAALELLQRDQADAGAGDAVIALRRIDHVALRVADVAEASARWCAQFGLVDRGDGRLACDDEPFCLALVTGEPHVAYEERRSSDARGHFEAIGEPFEEVDGGLRVTDPEGNRVVVLPHRPGTPFTSHVRPAGTRVIGAPRKLGHVNFLTGAITRDGRLVPARARHDASPTGSATAACGSTSTATTTSWRMVDKGYSHFHHLAFDVVDIGQMRDALDHLGRHGRWCAWGPTRHGIGGNIASYVRIVEEECFVELYCDMEQLEAEHEPRVYPDDRYSSNTWGALPPRSYFRFDADAVESEMAA